MGKIFALAMLLVFAGQSLALSSIHVPAVDASGEGILTIITANAMQGKGKLSVVISDSSLSHFFSVETQQSIKNAVTAAAYLAGANKSSYDIEFDIKANAEVVDGPSGGAAIALAVLAEFTGKKIRQDIAISGAISPEGTLSKVGGIAAKSEAAGKQGLKVLVVPVGQSVQDDVDLSASQLQKYGMQVVEARTLEQVSEYAFTPQGTAVKQANVTLPELELHKLVLNNKAQALKPLAQDAINQVAQKLEGIGQTPLANTTNKSWQLSQKLLANNYVYSAANEAFVTLVSLRTREYANFSEEKLREKLEKIEASINGSQKIAKTSANLEWAVASQLRQYWAKTKISDAKQALSSKKASDAAQSIAIASLWQEATVQLDKIALDQTGGVPLKQNESEEIAAQKIAESENETIKSGDGEARFHLDAAKAAFANKDFETAAIDASFALAFSTAINKNGERTPTAAMQATPDANESTRYASAWGQYYFAHAVYNKQEWKRTVDASYAINALKLYSLAKAFEETNSQLSSGNATATQATPLPTESANRTQPEISVVVTEVPQQGIDKNIVIAAIVAIAAVFTVLLILLRKQPPLGKSQTARDFERKLDALDEMLIEGKINEENYNRLRNKYEGILVKLSAALQNEEETAQAKKKKR